MEAQSLLFNENIKKEPDGEEAARNITNNMCGLTVEVKQEPVDERHTIKVESSYEQEKCLSPVKVQKGTSSTFLLFPAEDNFLYCEKCKMKYEGGCPEHGPLIYIDNAEVFHLRGVACMKQMKTWREMKADHCHGYTKDLNIHPQVVDNMDRRMPGRDKDEQSGVCLENEDMHTCFHTPFPFSSLEYKQIICEHKHLETGKQDELPEALLGDKSNKIIVIAVKKNGHFGVEHMQEENTKARMVENEMSVDSTSYQERTAEIFGTLNDCLQKSCSENCSEESNKVFSLSEKNVQLSKINTNYTLQSNVQIENPKNMLSGEKPYQCGDYGLQLIHLGDLPKHRRVHTGKKPYKCDVCGASFAQSGNMKTHRRIHTGEKPYKCEVCSVHFIQSNDLSKHTRVHTREKPYKCDICSASFADSSNLKTHKRIHTGEKPYKCDVCGVHFIQSNDLNKHKRVHTGERPYQCDVCGASFVHSRNLKKHKRIHTGEKPYKCDICVASFVHAHKLITHKRIHTGERPYKCDVCDASFARTETLKAHKIMHTGEKPYKCDVCDASFARTETLKTHKRIHTGEKPYKCDVCGACFAHTVTLKTHKRIHTGEKPYKCDVCGASFSRADNLKRHKNIHTGEKSCKCDVCDLQFIHCSDLNKHRRVHTGEKLYTCDVCSASFVRANRLKAHKRIHI